jgi:hypothetical protein
VLARRGAGTATGPSHNRAEDGRGRWMRDPGGIRGEYIFLMWCRADSGGGPRLPRFLGLCLAAIPNSQKFLQSLAQNKAICSCCWEDPAKFGPGPTAM